MTSIPRFYKVQNGISIELLDANEWMFYDGYKCEMIACRNGRCLFPALKYCLTGLQRNRMYGVYLQLRRVGDRRHTYNSKTFRWHMSLDEAPLPRTEDIYESDISPILGRDLEDMIINFKHVKIVNINMDRPGNTSADNVIPVHTKCFYEPHLLVTLTDTDLRGKPFNGADAIVDCYFPMTKFVTVTAYHNEHITALKIERNPKARAFKIKKLRKKGRGAKLKDVQSMSNGSTYNNQFDGRMDPMQHRGDMLPLQNTVHDVPPRPLPGSLGHPHVQAPIPRKTDNPQHDISNTPAHYNDNMTMQQTQQFHTEHTKNLPTAAYNNMPQMANHQGQGVPGTSTVPSRGYQTQYLGASNSADFQNGVATTDAQRAGNYYATTTQNQPTFFDVNQQLMHPSAEASATGMATLNDVQPQSNNQFMNNNMGYYNQQQAQPMIYPTKSTTINATTDAQRAGNYYPPTTQNQPTFFDVNQQLMQPPVEASATGMATLNDVQPQSNNQFMNNNMGYYNQQQAQPMIYPTKSMNLPLPQNAVSNTYHADMTNTSGGGMFQNNQNNNVGNQQQNTVGNDRNQTFAAGFPRDGTWNNPNNQDYERLPQNTGHNREYQSSSGAPFPTNGTLKNPNNQDYDRLLQNSGHNPEYQSSSAMPFTNNGTFGTLKNPNNQDYDGAAKYR